MSKKTEAIFAAIEKLQILEQQLEDYNKTSNDRVLEDINFELKQELKNLKFWIESLYSYNGKSTSYAKKQASKANGKKGGRPPKQVTLMRRRSRELEEEVLPELEHKLKFVSEVQEEQELTRALEQAKSELLELKQKLEDSGK